MEALSPEELKQKIQTLTTWRRGDQRAPHKPLLVLLALSHLRRQGARWIPYAKVDSELRRLLRDFGPPRKSFHPEYPFWRLQNDGLWEVQTQAEMKPRKAKADYPKSELLRAEAEGGFPEPIFAVLRSDPDLVAELATEILQAHFPESLWDEILAALGLDRRSGQDRRRRSPEFRLEVLRAYQRKCAVCDFDLRVGDVLVGLEAAHIRWHCYGGPDQVANGLALCALHHKLFDKGGFTIEPDRTLVASLDLSGGESLEHWLLRYHGQKIRAPEREDFAPRESFLHWHQREVFRQPSRGLGGS